MSVHFLFQDTFVYLHLESDDMCEPKCLRYHCPAEGVEHPLVSIYHQHDM